MRVFAASLNPNLFKILYVHFSSGSALDLLRQIALRLDLEPAHFRGDLVRQIADAVVRLNQSKKQHPILICDEAHLLAHAALEQLPLLLNFDMDARSRSACIPWTDRNGSELIRPRVHQGCSSFSPRCLPARTRALMRACESQKSSN